MNPSPHQSHHHHQPRRKLPTLTLLVLATAALAVACKPASKPDTMMNQTGTNAALLDRAGKELKAAARDLNEYTYAQKSEFLDKMRGEIAELNTDLQSLSAKVEKATTASQAEIAPKVDALRAQVAALNKQLDAAKDATESTWNDFKNGFQKGYGEVKEGTRKARQWLSEKVAP